MRPIDADKLKRKAQKVGTEAWKMNLTAKIETTLNQFIDWIDELPTIQTEPQWIPVSERLPEIGKYVLCYLKSRRYFGHYRVCIYRAADKYINHPYFDFNENGFPDVIAWMPLPEPYKPNK